MSADKSARAGRFEASFEPASGGVTRSARSHEQDTPPLGRDTLHDSTEGSIPKHPLQLAAPVADRMFFQTLYDLVDLYVVGPLSESSITGVGTAGNVQCVVIALTQTLGAGAAATGQAPANL